MSVHGEEEKCLFLMSVLILSNDVELNLGPSCPHCNQDFNRDQGRLRKHLSKLINCSECEKTFRKQKLFEEHRKKEHRLVTQQAVICHHCNQSFDRQSRLESHLAKSSPINCNLCQRTFCSLSRL